jgi:glycosyltransferase involved in cell wall biosynthesis
LAKATHPDFELVIIGDGPELSSIRSIAREEPWIRPLGALYGRAKADQLAAADLMLLPAWVGLSILDGFAAGLPVIAADFDNHSPEIAYLQNGGNGFITETTPQSYAAAISALLSAPQLLARMSDAALESANTYSLGAMVENFARGIFQTLDIDQAQK